MSDENKLLTPIDPDKVLAERRLWFDYLTRLNDRALQTARASGATSWLLIAAVFGLGYRGLSGLNDFISTPNAIEACTILTLLMFDILSNCWTGIIGVVYFCGGRLEGRFEPHIKTRARSIWTGTYQLLALSFGVAHLTASQLPSQGIPKKTLIFFGLYLLSNIVATVVTKIKQWHRARKLGIPNIWPQGLPFPPAFGGVSIAALGFAFGGLALVSLVSYILTIRSLSINWPKPFLAAAGFCSVVLILLVLLRRALNSLSRDAYLLLERDLVLENLTPEEVKLRFTEEVIGKPTAEWLREIKAEHDLLHSKERELISQITEELSEIEAIDQRYSMERLGRIRKLDEKYAPQMKKLEVRFDAVNERLKSLRDVSHSLKSWPGLETFLDDWINRIKSTLKEHDQTTASLRKKLDEILSANGKDQATDTPV